MLPLAQPPSKDDRSFDDWMYRLWRRIASTAGLAWSMVDKTGSNLTDIVTRNHNDLQNFQGGTASQYYHLTSAQNSLIPSGTPSAGQVPTATSGTASTWQTPTSAGSTVAECDVTIASDYSISAGKNGISVNPGTVASGVTLTIPSGSTWAIIV